MRREKKYIEQIKWTNQRIEPMYILCVGDTNLVLWVQHTQKWVWRHCMANLEFVCMMQNGVIVDDSRNEPFTNPISSNATPVFGEMREETTFVLCFEVYGMEEHHLHLHFSNVCWY